MLRKKMLKFVQCFDNKRVNVLILLLLNLVGNSQTIQLGTGRTESSNYNPSPVNIWYRKTVCQMVYTAAELSAAGASTTSPITQLGFYISQRPLYNLPNYTIKVKHTTQTNVATALGSTGWTTVRSAFNYSPTEGDWDLITLDGSFTWDGVNNIGVEICWSQVSPNYNASGKVYTYNTTSGFRYRVSDATGTYCGTTPINVNADKPQIKMVFIPGTSTTWVGGTSTNWHNTVNWTTGVPTANMDVVIPSGTAFSPIISGADGSTKNLTIDAGATLSIAANEKISVFGNWLNNGTFTPNSGNVSFAGLNNNQIDCASQTFYDLSVNSVGGVTFNTGNYVIDNNLNLNGGTVNTNGLVTLKGDATGTARLTEVKGICQYTLEMSDSYGDGWNGGYIRVNFDGVPYMNYACSGASSTETVYAPSGTSVELVYTAGQYEDENSYIFKDPSGSPVFSDGPTPATGSVFTTTSTCTFVNPMNGNMTVNCYIDAGATDWRFFTSPVSGTDLEQFDDDFITAGIPGSDYPTWPDPLDPWESIWFYNENLGTTYEDGLYAPSSMNDIMSAGQGAWMYSGDNSSGTNPFVVDVVGPANVGDINFGVTYNAVSGPSHDGWNLIGNPYACTIDWDDADWVKTNVANAIYIWNPDNQQYATYVGGLGVNGGSRYIAPFQAMYVQTTAASPQLIVKEACKVNQYQNFIKAAEPDHLRFKLTSAGVSSETAIRFEPEATTGFDDYYDAKYFANDLTPTCRIYSNWNGQDLVINTLPLGMGFIEMPLKAQGVSGLCTIELTNSSGATGGCIILEDRYTQTFHDFMQNPVYQFNSVLSNLTDRFILHLKSDLVPVVSHESCSGLNDGQIAVQNQGNVTVGLYNEGNLIASGEDLDNFEIADLYPGIYNIVVENQICGQQSIEVIVTSALPLEISHEVESVSCGGCCDGEIELEISGGYYPYIVNWMNNEIGMEVEDLCEGEAIAYVSDSKGCKDTLIFNLLFTGIAHHDDAENIFINYSEPGKVGINLNKLGNQVAVKILNTQGKVVYRQKIVDGQTIDFTNISNGLYLMVAEKDGTTIAWQKYTLTK